MLRSIVDYWSELDGAVHPEDRATFDKFPDHGFNLDFPPPAYIGDILNAPIIILDNNGGYNEQITPSEFPDAEAEAEFRNKLRDPRPLDRKARTTSSYYLQRNYTEWLISGVAALVNGVAYRSPSGRSANVDKLTKILPSALLHQKWLREDVFSLVESGKRFLIIHRWSRWNNSDYAYRDHPNAVTSKCSRLKDLTKEEFMAAKRFLNTYQK